MEITMARLQNYTLLISAFFGLATIFLGVILLGIFPSTAELAEGFQTPVIAFEFAKTESDLSFLSGNSELSRSNREQMDLGHSGWDMVFPFAYGGFIAFLLLRIKGNGHRFIWLGVVFAVLIIPFDINENLTLLKITSALADSRSTDALLLELNIATWLKWGAIGASIAVLARGFAISKNYISAIVALLASVGIATCWIFNSEPILAEIMSVLIFVFFVFFTIETGVHAWRLIQEKT